MTWFNSSYLHKKQIVIAHSQISGGADLSNFPVLISLTDTDLRTVGNGGFVQNSSGFDIIFTESTESSQLFHEIETYNGTTGTLNFWVKVPTVSHSVDTNIFVYFDNSGIASFQSTASSVWDSNYKGVWHMSDGAGASTTNADSTSNGATATKVAAGQPAFNASGKIGGCQSFNSANPDYETVASAAVNIIGDVTYEAWVNTTTFAQDAGGRDPRILIVNIDNTNSCQLATWTSNGFMFQATDSSGTYDISSNNHGANFSTNTWYHVVGTYTASSHAMTFYVNGISLSDGTANGYGLGSFGARIGQRTDGGGAFSGLLDELRVSNVVRSAGWIATEYNSQSNPGTFFSVGSLQSFSSGSVATWTYDTVHSRLTGSGGVGALFIYNSITTSDIDLGTIMDESDAGGLVWRYNDDNNYYELGVYDDHSSGGFTNKLKLYKVASGTRSLLGSQSTISFPRSTPSLSPYHIVRITMIGAVISVYFDGTLMQTYTDGSPLGTGKCGLRNDGGTSRYYELRIQPLGQIVTGTPAGDIVTGTFVYTRQRLSSTDPTVTPQVLDLTTMACAPNIMAGTLIPQKNYSYTFISKNFDDLARASNSYYWMIANNTPVFQDRIATLAPWCLYTFDSQVQNIQLINESDLYSNRQNLTGVTDVTAFSQSFAGDGQARSFTCPYPLASAPTITLNQQAVTIGLKGTTGSQYYYAIGDPVIAQDASQTLLEGSDELLVDGEGTYTTTVTRDSVSAQAAQAVLEGSGTGIVELTTDVSSLNLNIAAANSYGDQLNQRYAVAGYTFTFTTIRSGLAVGQLLPVFIPGRSILDVMALITQVNVRARTISTGGGNATVRLVYEVSCTQNYSMGNWSKLIAGLRPS